MDILNVEHGIIVQQANLRGVMGAGLAKQIADKWPIVKERYLRVVTEAKLGQVQAIAVDGKFPDPSLVVCNVFAQDGYGRDRRYTNYDALRKGLHNVRLISDALQLSPVYFPYGLGCGLGGGDWDVVRDMIAKEFYLTPAFVCVLDGKDIPVTELIRA